MTRLSRDAYGLRLAEAAASRADCTRRQVGAVIVAEDGSVVATGYNGLASGLPGCASAGACPRGQMAYPSAPPVRVGDRDTAYPPHPRNPSGDCTGRVGEDKGGWACTMGAAPHAWHVASTGAGTEVLAVWRNEDTHPADTGYEATGCRAVHAEVNAVIRAGRDRCVGATIYVTDEPCFHCSVVIEGAGLARVVRPSESGDDYYVRTVTATVPPPRAATGAPTLCTCPETAPEKRAATYTVAHLGMEPHAINCPRWGTMKVSNGAPDVPAVTPLGGGATMATNGMDPVLHAALVRSVERGRRRDEFCGIPDCYCDGRSHP